MVYSSSGNVDDRRQFKRFLVNGVASLEAHGETIQCELLDLGEGLREVVLRIALGGALLKLYEDNASTLTPDPLHSSFYDSHPPAAARIGRLLEAG